MEEKRTLFGSFFKEMRRKKGVTLRSFCLEHGFDPGNISKLERGIMAPPTTHKKLEAYALALGIEEASDDWYNLFDNAAASSGVIPTYMMNDAALVRRLPLVFRTLRGEKISPEKLDELAELIRKT